jgi:uncharacterized protein
MTKFRIDQLLIYPVRSLGGMSVSHTQITAGGSLVGDREWVVVRPDGSLIWQGDIPRMTLLSARLDNGALILIGHDGQIGPDAKDDPDGQTTVTQDGFTLAGVDQGGEVADWLSDQLGTRCRLVRIGEEAHRWGGLNPIHAISLASLSALNTRLVEHGHQTVEAERFRPNVILSGSHAAFAEEFETELNFGEASLTIREPCVRCELPNISRENADRGKQPLKMIGAMSKARPAARPASFGMYCAARGPVLRVGMSTQGKARS